VKKNQMPLDSLFQALGDRTRLRLLNLMADGEVCVCFLVQLLDEAQPKISRHLAYLRKTGLVVSRREGKYLHYRIDRPADEGAARILETVLSILREDRAMQRDRAALQKVCCATRLPEQLQRAPRPTLSAAGHSDSDVRRA